MIRGSAGCLLLLLFGSITALPQDASSAPQSTFRITSHIVYVDVVVRDSSGRIVRGLTEKDFHILEDHKEQQIDFFRDHTRDTLQRNDISQSQHDPLSFSNVDQNDDGTGAVNIILFDFFNTAPQDYGYARKQMIKFLEQLPPGRQTALFVLGGSLKMIQSFTGGTDRLVAAAKAMQPESSSTETIGEAQQEGDIATAFSSAMGRSVSPHSASIDGIAFSRAGGAIQAHDVTEAALDQIGAAVSGYPGRKNLFWLGETFPVYGGPVLEIHDAEAAVALHNFSTEDMAEANRAEATAQIAIYPINIAGIDASGYGAEAGGSTSEREMFTQRHVLYEMLNNLADTTGGHAYYGTNDFANALARGFEDGSSYYSLAYHPANHNWNGHYRDISVKLAQRGYSLTYRRGYYAVPDEATQAATSPADAVMTAALQPNTPQETLLKLKAKVTPPNGDHKTVRIDSVIEPANIVFGIDAKGRHEARLLVTLEALPDPIPANTPPDAKQKPPQTSGMYVVDVDDTAFHKLLTDGMPAHQELALPPGKYRLRLGVCDLSDHRVGTLDMPVTIDATKTISQTQPR